MIDTYFMQIESVKTRPNMGMWCRLTDVLLIIAERDKLLTDFAAVQAENEKLREVFKDYWIDQEKVHTDRTYQAFIGLGKHFDNWLKQKLEGK